MNEEKVSCCGGFTLDLEAFPRDKNGKYILPEFTEEYKKEMEVRKEKLRLYREQQASKVK